MAITLVGGTGIAISGTTGTTTSISVKAGDSILVAFAFNAASSSPISDNQLNTYSLLKGPTSGQGGTTQSIFGATAKNTGSLTVTGTNNALGASGSGVLVVGVFRGVASFGATNNAVSPCTNNNNLSPNISTTGTNSWVFAGFNSVDCLGSTFETLSITVGNVITGVFSYDTSQALYGACYNSIVGGPGNTLGTTGHITDGGSGDQVEGTGLAVELVADTGPVITASGVPVSGIAPLTVAFSSSVSGGVSPYSYLWTFGDGNTSVLANPTNIYLNPGTYNPTLQVTDNLGFSATFNLPAITVTSPTAPGSGQPYVPMFSPLPIPAIVLDNYGVGQLLFWWPGVIPIPIVLGT